MDRVWIRELLGISATIRLLLSGRDPLPSGGGGVRVQKNGCAPKTSNFPLLYTFHFPPEESLSDVGERVGRPVLASPSPPLGLGY